MTTLYDTLGLRSDCAPEAIKPAYHRAAKKAHPDARGGSKAAFEEIQTAYRVLSNPTQRAHYDKTGVIDDPEAAVEREVRNLFGQILTKAIEAVNTDPGQRTLADLDMMSMMRETLTNLGAMLDKERVGNAVSIARIAELKARFLYTGDGPNPVGEILANSQMQADHETGMIQMRAKILERLTEYVAGYDYVLGDLAARAAPPKPGAALKRLKGEHA